MTFAMTEATRRVWPEWLSRKEASAYLISIGCPVSARTLEVKASNNNRGQGPRFRRIDWSTVRYARVDLDEWARKRIVIIE